MLKYTGVGYLPDVPARDLSDDDLRVIAETQGYTETDLIQSGCYRHETKMTAPQYDNKATLPSDENKGGE